MSIFSVLIDEMRKAKDTLMYQYQQGADMGKELKKKHVEKIEEIKDGKRKG